jgi:uncharacterized protein YggE
MPYAVGRDMMAESKSVAPQVEAGSQDVTVNVSLSFDLY